MGGGELRGLGAACLRLSAASCINGGICCQCIATVSRCRVFLVLGARGSSVQTSCANPPIHPQVCDPLTPGCRLGPVVSEGQYRKILGFIEVSRCRDGNAMRDAGVLCLK